MDSLSFQVSCTDWIVGTGLYQVIGISALSLTVLSETFDVIFFQFQFLLFFCRKSAAFSMEEKTAFGSNELYSCHALQLKRIYISAFFLLLAAISYLIITVNKIQSPIPLVTEPGLLSSVSDSNSGYMKAGNRPLLRSVESWQENQSFQACRFLSLHCRHPTL